MNKKVLVSVGMTLGGIVLNAIGNKITAPIREKEAQKEFEMRLKKAEKEEASEEVEAEEE